MKIHTLLRATLFGVLASASVLWAQQAPTVTTDTRFVRGATEAFGRARFVANGSPIVERGFCWSAETNLPTIDDARSTKYISHNGLIFRMQNLAPATRYYARPYAIAGDGSVGYGTSLKIVTLPKGQITWGYDNGGSSDQNARINAAVEETVAYWNALTSIPNLYLNVHFGAGTPTADCSYGGWMRVGPNASYQRTGTIMHEALHAIGVGTTSLWYGSTSPLRKGSGTGQWLGERATEVVRFMENNASAILNGDDTHLWPYGINGAHEDTGAEALYIGCSLLAQAVGEDGLPSSNTQAFGTPFYSFDQEDTIRYYLRNARFGFNSSFLVETAGQKLEWQTMTTEETVRNDAAAWYLTFSPQNQYYQLRNAATGRYIRYDGTAALAFGTQEEDASLSGRDFQLMRTRADVNTGSGDLIPWARSYWIVYPDNYNATPPCLTATTDGATTASPLNLNSMTVPSAQHWLILTVAQMEELEHGELRSARERFDRCRTMVENWLNTPHIELNAGADASLALQLERLAAQRDTATLVANVTAYAEQLLSAGKEFLSAVCVTTTDQPFDLSELIVNAGFDVDASGWTTAAGAVCDFQEVEYYEKTVNCIQTISDLPRGTYMLKACAFQRPGSNDEVFASFAAGTNAVRCKLYIDKAASGIFLKNVMEDRQLVSLHSGDRKLSDGTYVPNTMESAAVWFAAGYFDNVTTQYHEAGDMKIGITGSNSNSGSWTIFDDFRLYFLGALTPEEISSTGLSEILREEKPNAGTGNFDLLGRSVKGQAKGFFIRDGKKFIVK